MTERSRYHHGDLRAALVEAGLALTRSGGPAALTIREVTRRAGVSPNAAYRHFADREALLGAVRTAIQEQMASGMTGTPAGGGADRLRAVGLGYIDFALREPGWFRVAFFGEPGPHLNVTGPQGIPAPFLALLEALDAMVSEGALTAEQRAGAEWSCFAAVHGFAELALHGPLRDLPEDLKRRLGTQVVDSAIAGVTAYEPG